MKLTNTSALLTLAASLFTLSIGNLQAANDPAQLSSLEL